MFRLYLVRHGVTGWNTEGRMQGHTDVPLAPEGLEQARLLADRLGTEAITAVWSSDLQRASATAERIALRHGLTVRHTDLLRETMLGEWEGLTEADIVARGDGERLAAYRASSMTVRPPGSEPLESVWERILCARDQARAAHADGTVVLVGHGGSLRALLCEAAGAPVTSLNRFWLDNASLSLIEYSAAGRVWIRLVNDTGHWRR